MHRNKREMRSWVLAYVDRERYCTSTNRFTDKIYNSKAIPFHFPSQHSRRGPEAIEVAPPPFLSPSY